MAGLSRTQLIAIILITTITVVFLVAQNQRDVRVLSAADIAKDIPPATSFQDGDRIAIAHADKTSGSGPVIVIVGKDGKTGAPKDAPPKPPKEPPIELTASNLQGFVSRCFQGEACKLIDDPAKMYANYKIAGNSKAIDQLISLMRLQLKDPDFKEKHQAQLKSMIDEFYPDNERQFQDAAFYDYAGDYKKSADLYLDLEKKVAADPSLRPAPPLNIANVLYEAGRFNEALPYYQKARADSAAADRDTLRFIDQRIEELQNKK